MKKALHGGNIHAAARTLGTSPRHILDLSASINPLGMPQSVQAAITSRLNAAVHYPDPDCVELSQELGAHHSINPDTILCGNGSTELIYLIARTLQPEQVLIPAPTFAEYERAIKASGKREAGSKKWNAGDSGLSPAVTERSGKQKKPGENWGISHFHLKERDGFRLNADAFITAMAKMVSSCSYCEGTVPEFRAEPGDAEDSGLSPVVRHSSPITHHSSRSLVFLCNPNNPTGLLTPREDVLKIARAAQKLRCYLVVDEAFIDFCPEHSVIDATARNPYLIVLRSMTKFYALAGIRLGYGVFPLAVMRRMREIREPWTVSTIAQVAGLTALQDNAYRAETMKLLQREKCFLEKSFRTLGIDYLPAAANFYLLKIPSAMKMIDALAAKGILLRSCANFRGLTQSHIRIAVRSRRDNNRFLKEITPCRP